MTMHETVRVELGARAYDIHVGNGVLAAAGALMAPVLPRRQVIVVTDETVAALHLDTLMRALSDGGIEAVAEILPPGEETKDFAHVESLTDRVIGHGIERDSTLVALGGGVIGDLAGFVAAIALRGIGFVQIPTTLLAQVDSSVGGKTGINTKHGKNLVGAFHQPRLVLADSGVLETLPRRQMMAGYAEVVKYGLIGDAGFFAWLEANAADLLDGDPKAIRHAVVTSCRAKAAIVAADEREHGVRALLNFGHTFGHALEAETGYGNTLLHGEAVSIGMVMAFDLSVRLGHCPPRDADRMHRHLAALGMPTGVGFAPAVNWNPARLTGHMTKDKKVKDGKLTFVLVRGIGEAFSTQEVPADELTAFMEGVPAS